MPQAGTAWIQVNPSLKGFHRKIRAQLAKELGDRPVKLPVEPDADWAPLQRESKKHGADAGGEFASAFRRRVDAALRSLPDIKVGADTSEADTEIAGLRTRMEALRDLRIGVDIDAADAHREIEEIGRELRRLSMNDARIDVQANTASAATQLAAISGQVDRLDGRRANVDVNVDRNGDALRSSIFLSRQISGLVLAGAAIAPAFVPAFGAAAVAAGGLASAIASAGVGVGALVAASIPSIMAVTEALKAQEQAEKSAATSVISNTRQRIQTAYQAEQAATRVADAQRAADRTSVEGARRVADARQDVTRAQERAAAIIVDAERRVVDAERALSRAQMDQRRAQQELTQAREDAVRALEDMRERTSDLVLSEESAEIALIEARQRRTEVEADANATALDRRKAALAVAEAEDRLSDVRRDQGRATDELNEAERKGISGSDQVVAAQQRIQDATRAVADANRASQRAQTELADAQVEAARVVQDAEQQLSDARTQAAQANADAARQVTAALEAQAQQAEQASLQAAEGTAAQRNLAFAMGQLTPLQKQLMAGWIGLRDAFTQWSRSLESATVPVFLKGMRLIEQILPLLTPIVRATAQAFSGLLDQASAALTRPFWQRFFRWLADTAGPQTQAFGQIIGNLGRGLAGLLMAFSPLATQMTSGLVGLTARFAEWGTTLQSNNGFRGFVDYVQQTWPQLKATLSALLQAFVAIVQAMAPLGGPVLLVLQGIARVITAMPPNVLAAIAGGFFAIAAATKVWAVAQAVLNRTMQANIFFLIITLIGALIFELVHAWQTSERFRNIVKGVLNAVKGFFQQTFDLITKIVRTTFNWIKQNWPLLLAILTGPIGVAALLIIKNWDKITAGARAVFKWLKQNWPLLLAIISGPIGWAALAIGKNWDKIRRGAANVRDFIVRAFRTVRDRLGSIWTSISKNVIDKFVNGFQRILKKARDIRDGVSDAFGRMTRFIRDSWNALREIISKPIRITISWINKHLIDNLNKVTTVFGLDIPHIPGGNAGGRDEGRSGGGGGSQMVYHSGGVIPGRGERPITALGGEGVVSPRGMSILGASGLAALNSGQAMGGAFDWVGDAADAVGRGLSGAWKGVKNIGPQVSGWLKQGAAYALEKILAPVINGVKGVVPGPPFVQDFFHGALDELRPLIIKWGKGEDADSDGAVGKSSPGKISKDGWTRPVGTGYRVGRGSAAHGYPALDLPAPQGTPIYSAAAGKVIKSVDMTSSYGRHIVVQHPGITTLYAHMVRRMADIGDVVRAGQRIGSVGSTGNSTGPHLHYETGNYDPLSFMRQRGVTFDRGGDLYPGMTLAFNQTNQRERILDPAETRAYERGPDRTINVIGPLDEQVQVIRRQMAYDDMLARVGN